MTTSAAADRQLDRRDIKTLLLAALGGALEFYDFIIFVFFAVVIGKLFFPPDTPEWVRQFQTYGVFAAGYLARPVGGIVMAHFGDKVGRKKMFTLSVFLMALPTLGMGLLPTYAQAGLAAPMLLLALRVLQGGAIGGEVPGAWVFVSEHVPDGRVTVACSVLTAGLTFGILLGSLTASAVNLHFSQEDILGWAWRIPFLMGGVFGFFAVWLRRWLHETPVFEAMRARKALAQELPIKTVMRDHWRSVAVGMLITWTLTAAIVVVILLTPNILQKQFAIPPADAFIANAIATAVLTVGCVLFGLAGDRFGAARVLAAGCVMLALTTWLLFTGLVHHSLPLIPTYAAAGFFVGIVGVIPTLMVRSFPSAVRFTGLSLSYNLAYAIFGGLTPLFLTLLQQQWNPQYAAAYYVIALSVMCFFIAFSKMRAPAAAIQPGALTG